VVQTTGQLETIPQEVVNSEIYDNYFDRSYVLDQVDDKIITLQSLLKKL